MARTNKQTNRHSGTGVTVWLNRDELERLESLVERLRLDRSKVLKLFINLYNPDELLACYMKDLSDASGGER